MLFFSLSHSLSLLFLPDTPIIYYTEISGLPNSIHLSHSTKKWLNRNNSFIIKYRGSISLKGRGQFATYWLLGYKNSENDKMLKIPIESDNRFDQFPLNYNYN